MRKITLMLFAMATLSSTVVSCDVIDSCFKGGKCSKKDVAEASAKLCSHCGLTSCAGTCESHAKKDSVKTTEKVHGN